ncbi:MAG: PAS domain-containing protein, partial [Candidatus Brocadiia bacterium]
MAIEQQQDLAKRTGFPVESIPDATYRLELDVNRCSYIAPWCESSLGFTVDEFLEMGPEGFESRIHPQDLLEVRRASAEAVTDPSREHVVLEYRFRRQDGKLVALREDRHILRRPDRDAAALVGMIWSADPQSRALKLAGDGQTLGKWNETTQAVVKDRNLRWAWGNERHAARLGVSPAELVGKCDGDFFPNGKAETFGDVDRGLFREPERLGSVSPFFVHEEWGELRQRSKALVLDTGGQVVGLLVTNTDVTEEEVVPGLPQNPAERLRSEPPVVVISADEAIRTWGSALEGIFGLAQERVRGTRLRYLVEEPDRAELQRLLRR